MMMTGIEALRAAKVILGTEAAVAEVVGRSQPYIHAVLTDGERVPAEWCIPLERATEAKGSKICRSQLRPDIYPELAAQHEHARRSHKGISDKGRQAVRA